MKKLNEMKLSSPWVTYFRKLKALFNEDPEVKIIFNEEDLAIDIYVESATKAFALDQLLKDEVSFGTVTVKVNVIPANGSSECSDSELIEEAFKGNDAFKQLYVSHSPFGSFTYAIFKKEVVQFFNDNLGDINGNISTLYEDIAREVFNDCGVFFCTEDTRLNPMFILRDGVEMSLGRPLGEWP